jgi:hypothetical protein
MHNRSGLATEIEASHEETKPAAMKRNEQQVNDLIDHIRNKMTDSFDVALHPALLITISTGMHASKDVQDSLWKTTSGFICTFTMSPERHFSFVVLVISSNDFSLDLRIGL